MQNFNQGRRPLLASMMSFFLPGFGQLYNGQVNKATWLFLCFVLICGPGIAIIALYVAGSLMVAVLMFSLLLAISIWLYSIIEAWRTARDIKSFQQYSWQLSGIYMLVFLLCILAQLITINYVRDHYVQSFRIPSASMNPGILPGDILFSDMRYNCPGCKSSIQRGDIAIFVYPNDRTRYYIKRIIALPGDSVRIKGQDVWINNKPLTVKSVKNGSKKLITERIDSKEWVVQWESSDQQVANVDIRVPPGQAFVLGDNRSISRDTRDFGTVPLLDIIGKARQIWFSVTFKEGVRWKRLGKVIK